MLEVAVLSFLLLDGATAQSPTGDSSGAGDVSDPGAAEAVEEREDGAPGETPEEESELPPLVERPDFMRNKPYMPDLLLKDKREGWYLTGFPAIGFDAEEGLTLGAAAQVFDNGARGDPFFRSTPYRKRFLLAAKATTENVQQYAVGFDGPYLFDSPYRLRAVTSYRMSDLDNYFGTGTETLERLTDPATGQSFTRFSDYERALEREVGGNAYTMYNKWKSKSVLAGADLQRDVLGGLLRPLIGLQFSHTDVDDYTGARVDAKSATGQRVKAIQLPTKLLEDHNAGRIAGFDGGWENFVKIGLTYDSRDFEPDPDNGLLAQATGEFATEILGSDFNYQRMTFSVSRYQSLVPSVTRLVLATRALYSMQFGDVPFFSLNTLAFNSGDKDGLGAFESLRGYKRRRFVGDAAVLVNVELRWSVTEWQFWGQHLRPILVPFVDAGRVFDYVDFEFDHWKVGYGGGLKLAWNLSTIISFDYAMSREDQVFYMEVGHQF